MASIGCILVNFQPFWQYFVIFQPFWQYLVNLATICRYLATIGHYLPLFGHYWPLLASIGLYWLYWASTVPVQAITPYPPIPVPHTHTPVPIPIPHHRVPPPPCTTPMLPVYTWCPACSRVPGCSLGFFWFEHKVPNGHVRCHIRNPL